MIDNNESQNKYHTQFCLESCVFSLNIKFNVGFQPFCSIFLPQIKEEFNYIEIKIFNKRKYASKFKGVHSSIVNTVVNFCELKIWLWINYCPVSLLSIHDSNFINQKILRTTHPLNVFFPSVSYILSAPWFWIKKKRHLYGSTRPPCDHIGYSWRHCQHTLSFRGVEIIKETSTPRLLDNLLHYAITCI